MGYVYSLIAALLFGANGSVTKLLVDAGLHAEQLTLFRVLGTAAISGVVLLVTDRAAFRVRPRQLVTFAVLGVTGVALLQYTYAAALGRLPVGITLLIEYTAVLLVAIVALVLFRERVRARLWVAIACVLAGLVLVSQFWMSRLDGLGVLLAIAAAVTLTVYFVVGEREVGKASPLAVAFWTMTFAAAFWLIFSGWWTLDPALLARPTSLTGHLAAVVVPLWVPLAWNIAFGSFTAFFLSFLALKHLGATAAGIIASSEVVFAFLFAWIWLGEGLDLFQLLGAAVVLVGIVLAQTARAGRVVDADLALPPAR